MRSTHAKVVFTTTKENLFNQEKTECKYTLIQEWIQTNKYTTKDDKRINLHLKLLIYYILMRK